MIHRPGRDAARADDRAAVGREIATVATQGDLSGVGGDCDEQFEYEFALDVLLDGCERLRAQGWTSRSR